MIQHLNADPSHVAKVLAQYPTSGPLAFDTAVERSHIVAQNHDRLVGYVQNAYSTTTIDAALKRTMILSETIRDFALQVLPLRMFAAAFQDVPLQGSDTVTVAYYPIQTTASVDYDASNGYQFATNNTTNKAQITVNKRKYQPFDYSSQDLSRQPFFNVVQLGKMNAQRLAYDVTMDVLSCVTNSNFGAAIKTIAPTAIQSDDITDIRGSVNKLNWPTVGRGLIVNTDADSNLQKDPAYKLALNVGTTSVIQQGKFPNLSGFEYAMTPNLPDNSEKLIGMALIQRSAILAAFAPVAPAPGVRHQLVAYEVVTDPMTGISLNYRHWGLAQADRDYEVIECAYGYQVGVAAALKRICSP